MPKARKGGGGGGGGGAIDVGLRWIGIAVAVLCIASAFAPMTREFARGLRWVICAFSLVEAGVSLGRSRKGAFVAYAAIAVLLNPIQPFPFPHHWWRAITAMTGIWFLADHLPGRPQG